jgi:hypothetical protein
LVNNIFYDHKNFYLTNETELAILVPCSLRPILKGVLNMVKSFLHVDSSHGARPIKQELVPLENLRLDPENVRFRHLEKVMSDQEIEDFIWKESDTKILFKQITASGGLSEPPYVTSGYLVKEGNRRIVCLRRANVLQKRGQLDSKLPKDVFEKVLVNIFEDGLTPEEMDVLLARWHVTGKKEWGALNQANHIWTMYNQRGMSFDRIRDLIGMSKGQVIQKCKAYEYTIEYMKTTGDSDIKKYSFFEEMYKKKDLRNWIEKNPTNIKTFFSWIRQEKFNVSGATDVRRLPEVLNDEEAMLAFEGENGNIERALFELQKKNPAISSSTFKSIEDAINALNQMPRYEFESIVEKEAKVRMLKTLHTEIEKIFHRLGIKF